MTNNNSSGQYTTLYKKAFQQIQKAKNILIATHDRPDGDAISSTCAIAEVLEFNEKIYSIYCYDQPSYQFNFLPHLEKFKTEHSFCDHDLIIALDCGNLKRTNLADEIKNKSKGQFIIEIDHHPKTEDYADMEIRNSQSASTTEIIYDFLKTNKIKINKNLANCILTGILTDTANFLYPSTSSTTINIASEMLRKGARLPQITENTWRNKSFASMKAWGKAMTNLFINPKYNFAVSILTPDDMNGELDEEELDGVAGFLSSLHNVKGILLLRQQKDGSIRGNLRTAHPKIDISGLAQLLGGGGHPKASGFTIQGWLEKTPTGWIIK